MTEPTKPNPLLEIGPYRLARDGDALRVKIEGHELPIEVRRDDTAGDLVHLLFDDNVAMGSDLDELRPALDRELARSSSLLANWQAAEKAHRAREAEWERDRVLAAELGREIKRLRAVLRGSVDEKWVPIAASELVEIPAVRVARELAEEAIDPATAGHHRHFYQAQSEEPRSPCSVCGKGESAPVHSFAPGVGVTP